MEVGFEDVFVAVLLAWIVALVAALVYLWEKFHDARLVMDYAKTYYVGKEGRRVPVWVEEVMMDKLGMERPDGTAGERGREPRHAKDAESSPDDGGDLSAAPAGAEVGSSGTFADLCADDGGNNSGKGKGAASGGNNSGKDGG